MVDETSTSIAVAVMPPESTDLEESVSIETRVKGITELPGKVQRGEEK